MAPSPDFDPAFPLLFLVNAAAGSSDADALRQVIESALSETGRRGELRFARGSALVALAGEAAREAAREHGAVVAVGGDGTLNTVAQAAHAADCAMGAIAQGTFNYFARTHGLPTDAAEAMRVLLACVPQPVQVAAVNDRLFLVNASVGLYPELLEDREAFKARFGRNRLVAFGAGCTTLLRAHRRLSLNVELGEQTRRVHTLSLFVCNNQFQLERLGIPPSAVRTQPELPAITALMLRPVGVGRMFMLMLRGAIGTLCDAQEVDHFEFHRMRVSPTRPYVRRTIKVAFDGEVDWMQAPLEFRVLERPLFLLKPSAEQQAAVAAGSGDSGEDRQVPMR